MMDGRKIILFVIAAGLGLAAGLATRTIKASRSSAAQASIDSASSPIEFQHSAGAALQDQSVAARLGRSLALSSGVVRWLCWLDAIEKAQRSDFPRLFQLAAGNAASKKLVLDR